MIYVSLTPPPREDLTTLSQQAIGRVALRAHRVLLSDRGFPVPQIAMIPAGGQAVVRTWLHRYQQQGGAGLEDEPRSGCPPKEPLAPLIVDTQASQSPPCWGHVQTCWRVSLLTAYLSRRFCLVRSCSSIRRLVPQSGWRWKRPRLAPARKRDPEAETKQAALEAAQRAAAAGQGHLLSLDEADRHLLPLIRAMWMKGQRRRVPTPGTNQRHACFGALDAVSGQGHSAPQERQLAVHCVAFLHRLVTASPDGPLALVLDQAPAHTAKVVQTGLKAHPRVTVLGMPT